MSKEHSAVFIGHSSCPKVTVKNITPFIENLVCKGVNVFYNGGMGQFDRITAQAVFNLKKLYPDRKIKNILVIPYLNYKKYDKALFDEVVFPFEKQHESSVFYTSAIPKRNHYMIDNAAFALCYVSGAPGGATDSYKYALDKGLQVLNTFDILE